MNVLSWLNSYVQGETELSPKLKSKLRPDSYFKVLARKENRFIREIDFSISLSHVFPSELLEFDEAQREEIDAYFRAIEKANEGLDANDFIIHIHLLAKVLSDFEGSGASDHTTAKFMREVYLYLLVLLKLNFPQVFNDFQRIRAEKLEKLELKRERPNCKHCGSIEVISYGINWMCKSCGRTFRKGVHSESPKS